MRTKERGEGLPTTTVSGKAHILRATLSFSTKEALSSSKRP